MPLLCAPGLVLALTCAAAAGKTHLIFTGHVVAITDGDTLIVLGEDQARHQVRLTGIDAPEKGQPFGTKAQEHLAGKVFGRTIRIEVPHVDWRRPLMGRIYLGERFINAEMVREGFAWRRVEYDEPGEFTDVEAEARKQRRGLWSDKDPMPPWEWRKMMAAHAVH
jgi:micrococcal nuclease